MKTERFRQMTFSLRKQTLLSNHCEQDYDAYLSISLEARGQGKVNIGNLHQRWSRKQFGKFVLGGKYPA